MSNRAWSTPPSRYLGGDVPGAFLNLWEEKPNWREEKERARKSGEEKGSGFILQRRPPQPTLSSGGMKGGKPQCMVYSRQVRSCFCHAPSRHLTIAALLIGPAAQAARAPVPHRRPGAQAPGRARLGRARAPRRAGRGGADTNCGSKPETKKKGAERLERRESEDSTRSPVGNRTAERELLRALR